MTFFNKKTEVMQIEMTPYGRYLYSIGKFKPHSYEFVDDDILYKASGSTEAQEDIHQRILNETPKLKINRSYQDGITQPQSIPRISDKRVLQKRMTQRQNGIQSIGRSSYSSDNMPSFQVTMLRGQIKDSSKTFETNFSFLDSGRAQDVSGNVHIPQVDFDFNIRASLRRDLLNPQSFDDFSSAVFDDGNYVSLNFENPIIHLKEFNSFYEKENFEIEVFLSQSDGSLNPLKFTKTKKLIENDLLIHEAIENIFLF